MRFFCPSSSYLPFHSLALHNSEKSPMLSPLFFSCFFNPESVLENDDVVLYQLLHYSSSLICCIFLIPHSFSSSPPSFTNPTVWLAREIILNCRVLCYHPDSELSMARMSIEQIEAVIDLWIAQMDELQSKYEWVQVILIVAPQFFN